jgi:hypothetical protein
MRRIAIRRKPQRVQRDLEPIGSRNRFMVNSMFADCKCRQHSTTRLSFGFDGRLSRKSFGLEAFENGSLGDLFFFIVAKVRCRLGHRIEESICF